MGAAARAFLAAGMLLLVPRARAREFATPSPSMLAEIRARHHPGDWWYVSTDGTRWLAKVRTVDEKGLGDFHPKQKSKAMPVRLEWSAISRIDQRYSRFLFKRITWTLYGGVSGATIPVIAGTEDGSIVVAGLLAGAVLGGWLGGIYGDGIVREEVVYVSPTLWAEPPRSPNAPLADSTRVTPAVLAVEGANDTRPDSASAVAPLTVSAPPGTGGSAPAAAISSSPKAAAHEDSIDAGRIDRFCAEHKPSDRLRIHADFGAFEGFATSASQEGLHELVPYWKTTASPPQASLLSWERIESVERAHSGAGTGARRGALILGGVGIFAGVFANAVAAGAGGETGEASWLMIGGAIGAGAGAILGAAIGSATTQWKTVYPR